MLNFYSKMLQMEILSIILLNIFKFKINLLNKESRSYLIRFSLKFVSKRVMKLIWCLDRRGKNSKKNKNNKN